MISAVTLHPDEPEPLFEQLADLLRQQIADGTLPPRRKLPTQYEPAEQYRVSRGTVLRATDALVADGLIRFVPGKGLFTAEPDVIAAFKRKRAAAMKRP